MDLTAQNDSTDDAGRQVGTQKKDRASGWEHIGLTPEMIRAGVAEWEKWQSCDNPYPETLVRRIYRVMRSLE